AIGVYAPIYVLSGMVNNFVRVVGRESFIGEQGVSVKGCTGFHMLAYFGLQCALATVRNDGSTNLPATLHDSHNGGLVLSARSGNPTELLADVHVPRFAADERFVSFNFAAVRSELAAKEFILQCQTNAMQHEPCRLLGNLE